jgi:hypothetical protein
MGRIFFRYIRGVKGKDRNRLVGCIAVKPDTGEIGWSYCSSTSPDRFRKSTARKIAVDRLGVYDSNIGRGNHSKHVPDRVKREIEITRDWLNRKNKKMAEKTESV